MTDHVVGKKERIGRARTARAECPNLMISETAKVPKKETKNSAFEG